MGDGLDRLAQVTPGNERSCAEPGHETEDTGQPDHREHDVLKLRDFVLDGLQVFPVLRHNVIDRDLKCLHFLPVLERVALKVRHARRHLERKPGGFGTMLRERFRFRRHFGEVVGLAGGDHRGPVVQDRVNLGKACPDAFRKGLRVALGVGGVDTARVQSDRADLPVEGFTQERPVRSVLIFFHLDAVAENHSDGDCPHEQRRKAHHPDHKLDFPADLHFIFSSPIA